MSVVKPEIKARTPARNPLTSSLLLSVPSAYLPLPGTENLDLCDVSPGCDWATSRCRGAGRGMRLTLCCPVGHSGRSEP